MTTKDDEMMRAAIAEQTRETAENYRLAELSLKKALHRWDFCKFNQRKGEVVFAGENLATAVRTMLKYYSVQDEEVTVNPLAPGQVLPFKDVAKKD